MTGHQEHLSLSTSKLSSLQPRSRREGLSGPKRAITSLHWGSRRRQQWDEVHLLPLKSRCLTGKLEWINISPNTPEKFINILFFSFVKIDRKIVKTWRLKSCVLIYNPYQPLIKQQQHQQQLVLKRFFSSNETQKQTSKGHFPFKKILNLPYDWFILITKKSAMFYCLMKAR